MQTNENETNLSLYFSFLWLILAQLTAGVNITSSKHLITLFDPTFLLFSRFLIASILLFILHYIRLKTHFVVKKQKLHELKKRDWKFILAQALCAGVIFNYLLLIGLHYTDASSAGIITSTLPAFITVLAIIFLGERLTKSTWLCIGFAISGLVVMNIAKLHGNFARGLLGDVFILMSLIPEATYYILAKIYKNQLPVFLLAGVINLINMIVALVVLLLFGHFPHHLISGLNLLVLFASGASSALFYCFWSLGCREVSGTTAGLFTTIMPISTLFLAWLFLDEKISLLQLVGMALVMISIVFNAKRPRKKLVINTQNPVE